jgi:tRNA threonylcarbamoyladenosine biosynthesis protein TsaE
MPTHAPSELTIRSSAPADTMALAGRLAGVAAPGDVICLSGELGAGKTVFAKGFGAGLGTATTITSPSFILMSEHAGRLPLFHLDLYRLEGPRPAIDSGLLDEREAEGVTLIEWPDRLGRALPDTRLDVNLEVAGETDRSITIRAVGKGLDRYLEAAQA